MDFSLGAFGKFLNDMPWLDIMSAAESGGTNVTLDVQAGRKIMAAAVSDFFSRTEPAPVPDAPATVAAVQAHVANAS